MLRKFRQRRDSLLILLLGIVAAGLAGCRTVGPDYKRPEIVPPPRWNAESPPGVRFDAAADESLAHWWNTFNDPVLDSLIDRAVAGNLDLRRADAVLREARARRGVADAARFPTVTSSGVVAFQRGSDRQGNAAYGGLFSVGFDAGWEVDVFGRVRRSIELADANLDAAGEYLRDTLVSLLAEVALNYVEIRQYQNQLEIAQRNLDVQERSLQLASELFAAGLTTRLDVDQAEYSVADTRSRIPTLRILLEQAKNRLAVLLGENPGELSGELREAGDVPVGPVEVVIGVPAETLRRRPDIRRAERILAARTAAIGVATAARYPSFALSGTIGYEAITKGNPLSLGNLIGSLAGSAFYTIFDAKRIRQNIEVQDALQEQALIDYESAILSALEEVENSLIAYADHQVRRGSLEEGAAAAGRALNLVQDNYGAGLVGFQPVLESQRAILSFQDQLAQNSAVVTSDLIRLYKALGGGWIPVPPPAAGQPNSPQQNTNGGSVQ